MTRDEITQQDATYLIGRIEDAGVEVSVDGGWGVDALLGRHTRRHLDLDIAVPAHDVSTLRQLLDDLGFVQIPTDDTWEHNFVVQDDHLRRIDVHSYILDDEGANIGGVAYAAHHLTGVGTIGDRTVRCIPPQVMVDFHLGYPPDAADFADVWALCQEFGLTLPEEYEHFSEVQPGDDRTESRFVRTESTATRPDGTLPH